MFRLGQPLQFGLLLGDPSVEIFPLKIGQLGREQAAIALNIPSMGLHPGSPIVDLHHFPQDELTQLGWAAKKKPRPGCRGWRGFVTGGSLGWIC